MRPRVAALLGAGAVVLGACINVGVVGSGSSGGSPGGNGGVSSPIAGTSGPSSASATGTGGVASSVVSSSSSSTSSACGSSTVTSTSTSVGAGGALPMGECHTNDDCAFADAGEACFSSDGVTCGGLCSFPPAPSCAADSDCGSGEVCGICPCNGNTQCQAPCASDTACPTGFSCQNSRCLAQVCGTDIACPANFTCACGTCARTVCFYDSMCDGYCVAGQCYASPGTCEVPPT